MNAFAIFIWKESLHILRDKRTLIILLGMPIIQVLLFGYAITNEINQAAVAIIDPTPDTHSRQLTNHLLASNYFKLQAQPDAERHLEPLFRQGKIKMAIIFPPHFGRALRDAQPTQIHLVTDASDPNTATTLASYASAIINDYQSALVKNTDNGPQLIINTRMMYNPDMKGAFLFVPGIVTVIIMLISAMLTSLAITREKENGTMEVLLVSPLHPALIIIGKVVPYIVLSGLIAFFILSTGVLVFDVPIRGSYTLLALELLLFIITVLALGIFISTLTSSQMVAMMVSMMGLMLPTILLSGFIFPIESMPSPLQVISHIIPARWFLIIIRGIMLKASTIHEILKETAILSGMALFFIGLSIRNFKTRLDDA
jgi:ABC-2 type transport system permease protein